MRTPEIILDYCFYKNDLIFTLPTQGIHLFSSIKLELNIFWCLNLGQKLDSGVAFLKGKPFAIDDKLRLVKWNSYFGQPDAIKQFNKSICCLTSDDKSLYILTKNGQILELSGDDLAEKIVQKVERTILFWKKNNQYLAYCCKKENRETFLCSIIIFPKKKIEFCFPEKPTNFWFSKEKEVAIILTKRNIQFYKYFKNEMSRLVTYDLVNLINGVVINQGNTFLALEKEENELLCTSWSLHFFQRFFEKNIKVNLKKPIQHLIKFNDNLILCESNLVHLFKLPLNKIPTIADVLILIKKDCHKSSISIDKLLINKDKKILNWLASLEKRNHWNKLFKFLNQCGDLNEFDAIALLNYSLEYHHECLSTWILKKNWTTNFMREALIFLKLTARFTEFLTTTNMLTLFKVLWWSKCILEVRGFDMSNYNLLLFQNFFNETLNSLENILMFRKNIRTVLKLKKKKKFTLYRLETIII